MKLKGWIAYDHHKNWSADVEHDDLIETIGRLFPDKAKITIVPIKIEVPDPVAVDTAKEISNEANDV